MTLVNNPRFRILALLVGVGWSVSWLLPNLSDGGLLSLQARRYGPTTPGGYTVRVAPQAAVMAHSQRQAIQVTIEDGAGKPANGVAVRFQASEGTVTTDASETRDGSVIGTFAVATGSDQPRTAVIAVSVEDVEITVFIDVVPAVYGR